MSNGPSTSAAGDQATPNFRRATAPLSQSREATILRLVNLIDSGSSAQLHQLLAETKPVADAFAAAFRSCSTYVPSEALTLRLNDWFRTELTTAQELTTTAVDLLQRCSSQGHPGHDRRHILYMDSLSALRHCAEDNITDYRSLFLIGALYHDVGRLPEPRLYGAPASGVQGADHQYLGYYLVSELLKAFPTVPAEISDSIAFSVLVHQTGKDSDNFAAQFVQRADREQLVGPEFMLRTIGCNVGYGRVGLKIPNSEQREHTLSLPGTPAETDIANHLEFYMRNLYPNIGSKGSMHAEQLKVISGAFLALAHGENLFHQLFAPEIARDNDRAPVAGKFKPPLKLETWQRIQAELVGSNLDEARKLREFYQRDDSKLFRDFLMPPMVPDLGIVRVNELDPTSPSMLYQLGRAWDLLDTKERERYRLAFAYGIVARDETHELLQDDVWSNAELTSVTSPVTKAMVDFINRQSDEMR